ncbi:immunity 49 family protein [Saccharopolyspora spinosa]|uniref:Immunity protein 49 of polymorphic toxin system n=1 Tax=Saccharopolyspora spinosa TaxID=60894 RepID=A0A2N3XW20_SACSN|nr:immunity 49 family protein [Saccharopolyspora spinosa]PKW14820.1 immunity protein 49 of polymorphic toxin system [Saccharopolyspora spinosa]
MEYLARHEVDTNKIQARIDSLEPELEWAFSRLGTKNAIVDRVFSESLMLGELRCAVDPAAEAAETRSHFAAALEAGFGLFVASDGPADPVSYQILGREFTLKKTGPRRYHRVERWLITLWLAVIFRDREKIDNIVSVPISTLRESGAEYDEFMYSWVDSLQKFFQHSTGLQDSFVATMDGTNPDVVSIASEEVLLDLLYPPIEMFYFMLRRDSDKFNESLSGALKAHRRYWSKPDRMTNSEGMIALGPLAVSVLAKQSSMDIQVESEYLPQHLLSGE